MGRRALQPRSPKQSLKSTHGSESSSPPPPPLPTTLPPADDTNCFSSSSHGDVDENASVHSSSNLAPPAIPAMNLSSSPSKGLDRVLLERNLEKLLTEQSGNIVSPELEKLLNSQDRCREPLDLTQLNLSLDDWEPNAVQSSKGIDIPDHASSMPDMIPMDPNSGRKPRDKAQLSVRFESEGSETLKSDPGKKVMRSKSYSGRQKRHGEASGTKPRKTNSESNVPKELSRDDNNSYCSTCSSSSSDDDDVYELPPRRAYGGVRISYVPNDALAVARRQQANYRSPTKSNPQQDKNCIIS